MLFPPSCRKVRTIRTSQPVPNLKAPSSGRSAPRSQTGWICAQASCRCEDLGSAAAMEMKVVEHTSFTISSRALECHVCRLPPKPHRDGQHLYLCDAGHVVCGSCKTARRVFCGCGGSVSTDCCRLLEDIGSRIEIKCACGGYFRYGQLKEHQKNCQPDSICTPAWRKCRLRAALVRCSVCRAILRPPVFKQEAGVGLCCGDCHQANRHKDMFVRCPDLEYLLKCVMVKMRRPYCVPGDEDRTKIPLVGSSNAIGKPEEAPPSKVAKKDKHIAESSEDMSEDGSDDKTDEEEDQSSSSSSS
ncbi:hypothetical protein U9M48_030322 [Paspalum notatum var. saurae]|uniref:Uncharacterized protein n=1 Tax=Paspalum notatum var. saurae TaxID=547442 RepID=A0AAQ3U179_PASNO